MDIILRAVKRNYSFLGGVLMISTGDPCQLKPIDGTPVWTSHHMITGFWVINMKHYVRARRDPDLQTMVDIIRTVNLTDDQIYTFERILSARCIPRKCVPSWDHVPEDTLRIVGTKAACEDIIDTYIQTKKRTPGIICRTFEAYDEADCGTGGWPRATESVRQFLSRQCLEPRIFSCMLAKFCDSHTTTSAPPDKCHAFHKDSSM